jgi:hypothetical protein
MDLGNTAPGRVIIAFWYGRPHSKRQRIEETALVDVADLGSVIGIVYENRYNGHSEQYI